MTELVDPFEIERIVGARRHRTAHLGRAVSAEERVYVLHSQECLDSGIDLRECPYSLALDQVAAQGDWKLWRHRADVPVLVALWRDLLIPATVLTNAHLGIELIEEG